MTPAGANLRGIAAIIGCMTSYTVNDALVKLIALDYPIGEVIFVRGAFTVLMLAIAIAAFGHVRTVRRTGSQPVMLRSLCDGLSTVCFVIALVHMKLADLAAILQVSPLILSALSIVLYREDVGWRRWAAIMAGFIGALFVVKPTPTAFDVWALMALLAAITSALRETQTRQIGPEVPTLVIAFMGALAILIAGILFAPFEQWVAIPARHVALLALAAVFVGIATYLMALAFRGVDLSVVAPFRYSYLLTSAIAGYLVFAEWPDAWSMAGAALIVASGIYALHREVVRRRQLAARVATAE